MSYCLKCKKKTPDLEPTIQGKRLSAKCACGSKKSAFVKSSTQNGGRAIDVKLAEETYKTTPAQEIDGYKLDTGLSKDSGKTLVYHNPDTNDTIVAHRGTKLSDKNDLKNDAKILIGTYKDSKRVKNATEITDAAAEKYKDSHISHTGHSLGGTTADIVAAKRGHDVYVYNPGTSPIFNAGKKTKGKRELNTTLIDPISVYSIMNPKGLTLHWPKSLNPHSLSNFK